MFEIFDTKDSKKIKDGRAGENKKKIFEWFDSQKEKKTFLQASLETGFSLPTVRKYYQIYLKERS